MLSRISKATILAAQNTLHERKPLKDFTAQYAARKVYQSTTILHVPDSSPTSQRIDNSHLHRSTHSMTTRLLSGLRAQQKVFSIHELFETILLHLPMEDIINLRRVSQRWDTTLRTSHALQRKCFFRRQSNPETWVMDTQTDSLRPLVTYANAKDAEGLWDAAINKKRFLGSRPAILNPMLFTRGKDNANIPLLARARKCETIRFLSRPDLSKRYSVYHDMYVTDPPVEAVTMCVWVTPRSNRRGTGKMLKIEIKNKFGVKFKHVINSILGSVPETGACRSTEYSLRVKARKDQMTTAVWMLGATFATEEEKACVEGMIKLVGVSEEVRDLSARPFAERVVGRKYADRKIDMKRFDREDRWD